MCITTAAFSILQQVVSMIAVCHKVISRLNPVQKSDRMFSCSCFRIMIEHDLWQSVFSAAYHPDKRLCLGSPPFFLQHLKTCFIHHQKLSFLQLFLKIFIHWLKVCFGTVNDPSCHGSSRDRCSQLFPVFFLPVQWHCVHELLTDHMCCKRWRYITSTQKCRNPVIFNELRFLRFFALWASISCSDIFHTFQFRRCKDDFTSDQFMTDLDHLCSADTACFLFFCQSVNEFLTDRDITELFVKIRFLFPLSFMGFDLNIFRFDLFCRFFLHKFIKQTHLPRKIFFPSFFTGSSKQLCFQI